MAKSARICGNVDCPEIVIGSNYCTEHQPKAWAGSTWKAPKNWRAIRQRVMRRDRNTCQYCGAPATEVDHVKPVSRGGTHDLNNLVASCKKCNAEKNIQQRTQH